MQNFIERGHTIVVTAPTGGLSSGDGVLVGSLFAVAVAGFAAGETGAAAIGGVYTLSKTTGEAWTQGEKLYWDASAGEVTATATDNTLIGCAFAAAASAATTGAVRLNGTV